MSNYTILIVEDDELTLRTTKILFKQYGTIIAARTEEEAIERLNKYEIDLCVFDLNINGHQRGLNLISYAKINSIYSIVLSGESSKKIIEESFVRGAKDFLSKPFTNEKLHLVMERFINHKKQNNYEKIIQNSFITKSKALSNELSKIKRLNISNKPVFIQGETGTGKRVIAHIIKKICECTKFYELNCSQYSEELIASELLGHKKGSFTGAHEDKIGILEKADNGIVFLDEIHSLSIKSQRVLLKAIEEKEFFPLGSNECIKSNFRVISATCEDVEDLILNKKFRLDLYSRLNTFNIHLSPLRDRPEDIEALFDFFISKQLTKIIISKNAQTILSQYSWPRNTREIQDLVENWVVNGERLISVDTLPNHIRLNLPQSNNLISEDHLRIVEEIGLKNYLNMIKKQTVESMIRKHDGISKVACEKMGANPSYISRFLNS